MSGFLKTRTKSSDYLSINTLSHFYQFARLTCFNILIPVSVLALYIAVWLALQFCVVFN